jgi:hypothetical protein
VQGLMQSFGNDGHLVAGLNPDPRIGQVKGKIFVWVLK